VVASKTSQAGILAKIDSNKLKAKTGKMIYFVPFLKTSQKIKSSPSGKGTQLTWTRQAIKSKTAKKTTAFILFISQ
jgi:hypothetical protein